MASENAKAVAREVIETVRKGQKVILGEIVKRHGYSRVTAKSPTKVTKTKTYRREMKPILDMMIDERNAALKRAIKVRNKAKYRDLIDGADKLTKNIQLLSGGATEAVKFSWAQ